QDAERRRTGDLHLHERGARETERVFEPDRERLDLVLAANRRADLRFDDDLAAGLRRIDEVAARRPTRTDLALEKETEPTRDADACDANLFDDVVGLGDEAWRERSCERACVDRRTAIEHEECA